MATIHMILQGKGGVGKSFIASLLTQYLLDKGHPTACFDTDPVNATFSSYKGFSVATVDVMEGDNINSRHFDTLIEELLPLPSEAHAVIDNGASTFIPLASYIAENSIADFLTESGHSLNLHTVITGGQAEGDTIQGLNSLLRNFSAPVTIWVNPYFGAIKFKGHELEKENYKRGGITLELPTYRKETFIYNLETMLAKRWTFDEAINNPLFKAIEWQRFKIMKEHIWNLLDQTNFSKEVEVDDEKK